MKRILLGMSMWGFLFLIGSSSLGLAAHSDAWQRRWHIDAGLFTAFFFILIHSIVFVHLLGTGLGVKRALFEHRLPQDEFVRRLWRCKMLSYPAAFACMVVTIMTAVAGGAVQANLLPSWLHGALAGLLLLGNALTLVVEVRMIDENSAIMAEVEELIARQGSQPPVASAAGQPPMGRATTMQPAAARPAPLAERSEP